MIQQIFTVLDTKTEAFLPPFYALTVGAAIRSFGDTVKDPSHHFAIHPDDFVLYHLGAWDDADAVFDPLENYAKLGTARDFLPTDD